MHFQYGEAETGYLSRRDERMAAVIAQVGHIEREVDADLFSAVVHHIVGQQISTKAQATIWKRMRDELGTVDAAAVLRAGVEKMQSFGMTFRKAEYITDFARKIERKLFEKYRRRFSPYCSVASLYLWAAAGGAVPGLKDHAPAKRKKAG